MTLYDKLKNVIDIALKMLQVNKVCTVQEDNGFFYVTGCGDNGEVIRGEACVKINKNTMECEHCYHDDPCWKTPKKKIMLPNGWENVFIVINENG